MHEGFSATFKQGTFWDLLKINKIRTSGSLTTSHDAFFNHLQAIENLIIIEIPGVLYGKALAHF